MTAVMAPALESSVITIYGKLLATQLLSNMGATSLYRLTLFGRLEQLTIAGSAGIFSLRDYSVVVFQAANTNSRCKYLLI